MKPVKRKYTTITIPAPLFEKLGQMIEGTGFSSVSDYVTYILRDMVVELKNKEVGKDEHIKAKLKALGYL